MQNFERLYTLDGSVVCFSHMENSMTITQKLKINLLYDPYLHSIELIALSQRDICTPIFKAVLYIIAKQWKQLKYTLMDK